MEHTYRRVMTWLTPPNSVYKYVPDVNDTMSRRLKAFTSLRTYQGAITHFLWDMKIIKICFIHTSSDVSPWAIIKKRQEIKKYLSIQCKFMSTSHLLQLACNQSLVSSVYWLADEKISVDGSPYFQCKPTGGCPGTIQPKRLAETPQSCVHG